MIGINDKRRIVDVVCLFTERAMIAVTAVGAYYANQDPVTVWYGLVLQPYVKQFLILSASLIGVVRWVRHIAGHQDHWDAVKCIIDQLRSNVVNKKAPADTERVTLFKWGTCFRVGSHFLKDCVYPVERSGHVTRTTKACFLASDAKAVGVAGVCWRQNQAICVNNLPDIDKNSTDENIAEYARRGFVPESWVRKQIREGKLLPRTIAGWPVKVAGKPWGVIVVDSRKAELCKTKDFYDFYKEHAECLSKLLRRF